MIREEYLKAEREQEAGNSPALISIGYAVVRLCDVMEKMVVPKKELPQILARLTDLNCSPDHLCYNRVQRLISALSTT
jgi:hypothetical protein